MRYEAEMFHLIRQLMKTVGFGLITAWLIKSKKKDKSGKKQAVDTTYEEFVEKAVARKDRKSMAFGDDP